MHKLAPLVILLGLIILLSGCLFESRPSPTPAPTTVPRVNTTVKVEGKILFVRSGNIWLWDNGSTKQITKGGHDTQPSWHPNGTAFAYVNRGDSRSDIMVANAGTNDVKPLTNTKLWGSYSGWVFWPTWSPDGKKLAYMSDEGGYDLGLWLMNADGSGRTRIASAGQGSGGFDSPTWSPDGKQIAMAGFRTTKEEQIWSYTLATGKWQQLTDAGDGAYDPRWSPSGEKIAFVVRDAGKHYLWLMDANGQNAKQLTADGMARAPAWSFDGSYLAYVAGGNGSGFDLWVLKVEETAGQLTTSEPKQLTKGLDVDPGAGLSWLR